MRLRTSVALVAVFLLLPSAGFAAPGAPSNLTASVINQAGGGIVTLAWNLAPGEATTTIAIEAGSASGASNLGTFDVNPTSPLMVTAPAGTYFVRIRARGATGTSGPSNEITVVVGASGPCVAPSAPGNLNFSVSGLSVLLTWTASPGVASYVVSAGTVAGGSNVVVFDTGSPGNSLAVNAGPGVFYVRVAARNACGTSGPSNEVAITVGGGPAANVQITFSPNPVPFIGGVGSIGVCAGSTNTWFFTASFVETGGVGVTFTSVSNLVDGVLMPDLANTFAIPARGTRLINRQFCFGSTNQSHTIQTTYHGIDTNGRAVSFLSPTVALLARPQ